MGRSRPGRRKRTALTVLAVFGIVLFSALGIWQVERRIWKLALIEAVDARVQASPVSAPPPAVWPSIERERHAYLHVVARGRFLHDRETLVRAVTDLGTGFWVLTPLGTDTGFVVLVNRGYVPPERAVQATRARNLPAHATVTGLLRTSEPGGAFLRRNDPVADRWFSRDVQAIAAARQLVRVAPYFIDADADARPKHAWPRAGLTVIRFQNNHLVYALTWFGLAGLCLVALVIVRRTRA